LFFLAGLMHGRSVIILESLKRKFDWPRAQATNDFLGVAHPLNLRAKEMNENVLTLDTHQESSFRLFSRKFQRTCVYLYNRV
jgi:hypothetical protein